MAIVETLGGMIGSGVLNAISSKLTQQQNREDLDYMQSRYLSPQAQVNNLAAAGINPAVAMGNQSPVFSSGGSLGSNIPVLGTQSINDMANSLLAIAQAKKAGVDTRNVEVDTAAKQFELDLSKIFSSPQKIAELTLAWKNVRLADDEHNIKEWSAAKEKALSEAEGNQRDILKKTLDNMDTQLEQENKQREEDIKLTQEKQKTEKTSQSANVASANASNAAAAVSRENRRLQAALADVEEAGKLEKINSLLAEYKSKGAISDADAKEAKIKLDRLSSVEDKRSSTFFREVDNYLEWLKNKVSIFKTK